MYEEYIKERKIFIYNTVKVVREDLCAMTHNVSHPTPCGKGPPTLAEDDDVVKYDYNVLQEISKKYLIIIISHYYYII